MADHDSWSRQELGRLVPDPAAALDEALEYVCCPICRVLAGLPFAYFAALPGRWPEEPALREAVSEAQGFCNPHTWRLAGMQSQAAVAEIYVDILAGVSEPEQAPAPCPLCQLQRLAEEELVALLAQWLSEAEFREQYRELFGVCYRHFRQLLAGDLSAAARELLVTTQEESRAALAANLQGFLEKSGAQAKWTRSEAERRSARRTLLKLAGNEEA